jgi:hypothetical protein
MPLDHLLVGLLGGVLSAVAALIFGWGVLAAIGLYLLGGNLAFLASVALEVWIGRPPRRPQRPAPSMRPARAR